MPVLVSNVLLIHCLLNLGTIRHLCVSILLLLLLLLSLSTSVSFLLDLADRLLLRSLLRCGFLLDFEDGLALFFDFVIVSLENMLAYYQSIRSKEARFADFTQHT